MTAALCAVALCAFAVFRTVPASRLWKGYRVLYVISDSLTDAQVHAVLARNGCKDVVARSNQGIPIVSRYSPVQMPGADSYITKRNVFFRDESNTALLCYVPEGQDRALARALDELQSVPGAVVGTDGTALFPWLSPLVCAAFALVCVVFARRRCAIAPALLFLLAFSLSRPQFTTGAAVCLASYGFFMLQKIWGRHGFLKGALSPLVVICLFAPVALLFVSSPLNVLFYVVALVAGGAALLLAALLKTVYDERRRRHPFAPILIRGARFVPLLERGDIKVIALLAAATAVMLLVSLAGTMAQPSVSEGIVPAVPAPAAGSVRLPDLDDFLAWSWQTITFPYRRLSDGNAQPPVDGDTVVMPEYAEENGIITEREKTAYVYNGAFRSSMYDSVRHLPYPALEKMLLRQGKDMRYSYARGGRTAGERFGSALLVVFMLIPAGIIGYVVLVRRHYGISF